jgi:hypothetical protein
MVHVDRQLHGVWAAFTAQSVLRFRGVSQNLGTARVISVRARFHPANAALTQEFALKTVLRINPDDQPRLG